MRIANAPAAGWLMGALAAGVLAGALGCHGRKNNEQALGSPVSPAGAPAPAKRFTAKDSPIVIAGGSIRPTTTSGHATPWSPAGNSKQTYSASLTSSATNPPGIDYIVIDGFTLSGSNPTTVLNTGGWAITYIDKRLHIIKKDDVEFCSDSSCSAKNHSSCAKFSALGPVYVTANDSEQWEEVQGPNPSVLRFHDMHFGCDKTNSGSEGSCDKISKITLQTCNIQPNGSYKSTYVCPASASGHCDVGIGESASAAAK